MSGGIAYVLDVDNVLYKNLNKAMISIEKVDNKYDKKELRDLIEAHVEATGSEIGKKVLADFDSYLPHFKKLIPDEYKRMIKMCIRDRRMHSRWYFLISREVWHLRTTEIWLIQKL